MDFTEISEDDSSSGVSFQRTDSFRKVLPSKPSATVDSRLSMSMKMIDRPVVSENNNRGNKMFMPYMLEYAIMAEYQMLQKQELTGIYVIPSDLDPLVWFGVIFIRQGLYQGGIFRFQLHLSEHFPDGGCPKVIFESKVLHPAVNNETGELNLSEEFKEWKKKVNHVWHVLQYIRRIFYTIESRSPVNLKAFEMYVKDNAAFKEMVRQCVDESQKKVYEQPSNEDANYIHFEPISDIVHGSVKGQIIDFTRGENIRNF